MTEARFDALRTIAFGAVTNAYQPLGAAISHSFRTFKLINTTDADMLFSFDGTNDNIVAPATSITLYDVSTNSDQDSAQALRMSIGTQFLVKYSTAPTKGNIWLEGMYQKGQ